MDAPAHLMMSLARRPILGAAIAATPAVFFSAAWWRDRGLSADEALHTSSPSPSGPSPSPSAEQVGTTVADDWPASV